MDPANLPTRRQLFNAIGLIGGTAAIYNMMTTFGHAAETQFTGPPNLQGARKGQSVIVLGAGLAGSSLAQNQLFLSWVRHFRV